MTMPPVLRFELPPFYCPLPESRPHPDEALLERRALDWMDSLGLFADPAKRSRAAGTRSHELMARAIPDAPAELVQLGVDWSYLAFAFDDFRTDTGVTSTDTARLALWFHGLEYASTAMDPDSATRDPIHAAGAALSQRIRELATPALWRRWLNDNRGTYLAALWESAHRATGQLASFNDFLTVRRDLALSPSWLTCAEIATALEIPEAERYDPLVRAATEAVCLLVGLDDDLYSYPKERWLAEQAGRTPDLETSPIPILMRERHVTADQAARLLGDMRDRITLQAIRLFERVTVGRYSSDTRAMLGMALRSVRSCLDWAQRAERYTNPDGRSPRAVQLSWAGITDIPPKTDDPLPYPAIAWWWSL